jgi:hypothetical protein
MKIKILKIRLDEGTKRLLMESSRRSGKSAGVIAQEALRRRLGIERFRELRQMSIPYAEASGFFTDEDVFSKLS